MTDTTQPPTDAARVTTGDQWQHVKRGTAYEVIGIAELQAGQLQAEHAELVIYRGDDGKLWARNSGEFMDGRFVRLSTRQQPEAGMEGEGEAVAWMRRCAFDKNEGTKGNRPRGWTLQATTETKLLGDDVPLYAATRLAVPTGVGRDEVARVIDPYSWDENDGSHTIFMAQTISLAKADRILSLLSHAEAGGASCDDRIREWRTAFDEMHQRAMRAEASLRAHAEAGGVEVPSGWRLVPVEPTEEMLVAAQEEWMCVRAAEDRGGVIWSAMLAASPAPVAGEGA